MKVGTNECFYDFDALLSSFITFLDVFSHLAFAILDRFIYFLECLIS